MVPKTEEKKSRKLRSKSRDAAAESKESSETAEAEKKQDVEMEEKKVWNPKTKAFDIVMVPKTEEKKSRKLRSKSRDAAAESKEAAAEESSVDIVQQRKQRHEEKKAWNPKTRTFDIVMVPKQDKPEEKKSRKTKS